MKCFYNFWFLIRCRSPVMMWPYLQNSEFSQLQVYILCSYCLSYSSIDSTVCRVYNIPSNYNQFICSCRDAVMFLEVKWRRINDTLHLKSFRDNVCHTFIHKSTHILWNLFVWRDDICWFKKLCINNI